MAIDATDAREAKGATQAGDPRVRSPRPAGPGWITAAQARPAPDRRLLAAVAVTGVVTVAAVQWFTPPPAHPVEYSPAAQAIDTLFLGGLFVGAYALVLRRSFVGFAGLAVAAWALLAGIVACPVSGHHTYGMWWAAQVALGVAFGVCATVAAAVSRRSPAPPRSLG
jgi:hypothetical protein